MYIFVWVFGIKGFSLNKESYTCLMVKVELMSCVWVSAGFHERHFHSGVETYPFDYFYSYIIS